MAAFHNFCVILFWITVDVQTSLSTPWLMPREFLCNVLGWDLIKILFLKQKMHGYTIVMFLFHLLFSIILFVHFLKWQSDLDPSQNYRNRSNLKSFSGGNGQMPSSQKPTVSNHRRLLGRSLSQKDLKSNDGYSVRFFHLTCLRKYL